MGIAFGGGGPSGGFSFEKRQKKNYFFLNIGRGLPESAGNVYPKESVTKWTRGGRAAEVEEERLIEKISLGESMGPGPGLWRG